MQNRPPWGLMKPPPWVPLDSRDPLAAGLKFHLRWAGGAFFDAARGLRATNSGCLLDPLGLNIAGSAYAEMADSDAGYFGDLTLVWRGRIRTGGAFRHFLGKHSGNGSSANPFDWRTDNSATPNLALVRANGSSMNWSGPAVTLGAARTYAVTIPADIAAAPTFWIDGNPTLGTLAGGSATGIVTGTTAPIRVGQRADGAVQMDGVCEFAAAWSRILPRDQIAAMTSARYGLFLAPTTTRLFLPAAGGTAFAAVASGTLTAPSGSATIGLANTYAAVAAGGLAAPTGSAAVVRGYPAVASGALGAPSSSATVGLVNTYAAAAAGTLATPSASAAVVEAFVATASGSLAAPSGVAGVGLVNAYAASASGSLAAPSASAAIVGGYPVAASGSLAAPSGTATAGLVNTYAATASGSLAAPSATASAVLAFPAVASGTLAAPSGTAAVGLVNSYAAVAAGTLASPSASAAAVQSAANVYAIAVGGSLAAPAATAAAGLVNTYPAVVAGSLAAPSGSATIVKGYPAVASGTLATPSGSATIGLVNAYPATASGTLAAPSASATVGTAAAEPFVVVASGALAAPASSAAVVAVTPGAFAVAASGALAGPSAAVGVGLVNVYAASASGSLARPACLVTVVNTSDPSTIPSCVQDALIARFDATPALVAAVPGGLSPWRPPDAATVLPYATLTEVGGSYQLTTGPYIRSDNFQVAVVDRTVAGCKAAMRAFLAAFNPETITGTDPLLSAEGRTFGVVPSAPRMDPGTQLIRGNVKVYRQIFTITTQTSGTF